MTAKVEMFPVHYPARVFISILFIPNLVYKKDTAPLGGRFF